MSVRFLNSLRLVNLASNPATGSLGDLYYNTTDNTARYYNGTSWISIVSGGGGGGASVVTDVTAPSSPADGDLWYNSTNGVLYIYYQDADSSQWVMTTSSVAPSGVSQSELDAVEALALLGL